MKLEKFSGAPGGIRTPDIDVRRVTHAGHDASRLGPLDDGCMNFWDQR